MIEFKRAGDVMTFECPAFKVEIIASGAERIGVNPDRHIAGSDEMMALLTDEYQNHPSAHAYAEPYAQSSCRGF